MKIVVAGFAGAAISIMLVEDFEIPVDETAEPTLVWFDDFVPTIGQMIEENEVDEIMFFGHQGFIIGLANLIDTNFNDKDIVLTIIEETEVEDD